jgi:hypothetical protein
MATVDAQVLGYNATDYIMTTVNEQIAINAVAAHKAVTIGTLSWSNTKDGLYATHAYAIIGYNATTKTYTLYNPWGSNQPGQLTWSQLRADCSQLCVCDTSGSVPFSGGVSKLVSAVVSLRSEVSEATIAWPSNSADMTAPVADASPASDSGSQFTATTGESHATNESHEVFAVLGGGGAMHSHQTRAASATQGVLSAPLVDAMFAADGLLSQSEALATFSSALGHRMFHHA